MPFICGLRLANARCVKHLFIQNTEMPDKNYKVLSWCSAPDPQFYWIKPRASLAAFWSSAMMRFPVIRMGRSVSGCGWPGSSIIYSQVSNALVYKPMGECIHPTACNVLPASIKPKKSGFILFSSFLWKADLFFSLDLNFILTFLLCHINCGIRMAVYFYYCITEVNQNVRWTTYALW